MARDVSIAFKASDNLTNSIQSMRRSVDGLSRDVSEYRRIQAQAFDKRTEIKFDITKAKAELKELEKALKQNAEGSEQAFKEKQRALEDLQEEYKRLTRVAQEASKAENRLQDDINRTNNSNLSRMQGVVNDSSGNGLLKGIATSGIGNMLAASLQTSLNQTFTSMYGETAGSAVGNMVGGVVSGATIGSLAGPIGAAVGAAVGGLTGAINTLTEQQQKKDDYFKDEAQSLYNQVQEEQGC